jgi:3-deoxy-D-manno-octulosonic acid kinase
MRKDYTEVRDGAAVAWVLKTERDAVARALLQGEGLRPLNTEGRAEAYAFSLGEGEGVLRRFRRGGFISNFLSEGYLLENRPRQEFDMHRRIYALGLPVPEPLGVAWLRRGPWYMGAIATRRLNGESLDGWLQGKHSAAERTRFLRGVGETIARFHDAGVYHADLNVRNILLSSGKTYLIDFDRARLWDALTETLRSRSMLRLKRSFEKRGLAEADYGLLCDGYGGAAAPKWLERAYAIKAIASDKLSGNAPR